MCEYERMNRRVRDAERDEKRKRLTATEKITYEEETNRKRISSENTQHRAIKHSSTYMVVTAAQQVDGGNLCGTDIHTKHKM